MKALTKAEAIRRFGSWKAYIETRPTLCQCRGSGVIPPHRGNVRPNDGLLRVGCPYHRVKNEWWPRHKAGGGIEFIQTIKNGVRKS